MLSWTPPVDGVPFQSLVLGSVHCEVQALHRRGGKLYPFSVSNLSLSSSGPPPWCSQAHLPTSAPFRARPPGRHPAGYPAPPPGAAAFPPRVPAAFGRAGIRLLGIQSRRGIPPLSRSAYRAITTPTPTGFPRSAHTRHERGGCPLYPETSGVPTTGNGGPSAFPWASHPHGQDPQTHARAGSISNTDRELRTRHNRPPTCEFTRNTRPRVARRTFLYVLGGVHGRDRPEPSARLTQWLPVDDGVRRRTH